MAAETAKSQQIGQRRDELVAEVNAMEAANLLKYQNEQLKKAASATAGASSRGRLPDELR